ncbi:MAG: hypothetical protein R6V62_09265 [Candidatus Fermentibacteraceae bacterium]
MHSRYACIEISTTCDSCGQPFPLNGPYTVFTCLACLEEKKVPPDTVGGLINDFEDEYEGLLDGQGSGGTLMSGSGTYKYGLWRLPPRCPKCKKVLPLPGSSGPALIACTKCGESYHYFPAPDWLMRAVPSAVFCITAQPPPDDGGREPLVVNDASATPVVMSCPKCAGALSVTTGNERVMKCAYCGSEVYVPDAVWTRLHPVRKTLEWFVGLGGPTQKQINAQQRVRDEEAEKKELDSWKVRTAPRKAARNIKPMLPFLAIIAAIVAVMTILFSLGGESAGIVAKAAPIVLAVLFFAIPLWIGLSSVLSGRIGPSRGCKQALAALAAKHGWKHDGAEFKNYTGTINDKYRGRDIEIDPADEYAIEVEVDDSVFYLRSEPPGYPPENMQRFTTESASFNDFFPIRYAKAETVERMKSSIPGQEKLLLPFTWFMQRWEGKLARMLVDWSSVQAHIAPGHLSVMDSPRYLLPEDIEPLLEDMVTLAAAIDAVGAGREPNLPGQPSTESTPETAGK